MFGSMPHFFPSSVLTPRSPVPPLFPPPTRVEVSNDSTAERRRRIGRRRTSGGDGDGDDGSVLFLFLLLGAEKRIPRHRCCQIAKKYLTSKVGYSPSGLVCCFVVFVQTKSSFLADVRSVPKVCRVQKSTLSRSLSRDTMLFECLTYFLSFGEYHINICFSKKKLRVFLIALKKPLEERCF